MRVHEKLTAFLELERAIYEFAVEFDLVTVRPVSDYGPLLLVLAVIWPAHVQANR